MNLGTVRPDQATMPFGKLKAKLRQAQPERVRAARVAAGSPHRHRGVGHVAPSRQAGFTMVELIAILILVGVLAVVAMPKLDVAVSLRNDTARDEVLAALRYAGQTALSHRRLVCADVSATAVTLRIATNRPATVCDSALTGPDGGTTFTTNPGAAAFSLSPGGTMYFQPDGRVTSDGAGTTTSARTLTIAGVGSISIGGESGLVR